METDGNAEDSTSNNRDGNLSGDSTSYISNVPYGSGKALDLSNGVNVKVNTGGNQNVFDADNNFSISMWVKDWPSASGESLIAKNDFDPGGLGNLKKLVDASNAKYMSKDASINPPPVGTVSPFGTT